MAVVGGDEDFLAAVGLADGDQGVALVHAQGADARLVAQVV